MSAGPQAEAQLTVAQSSRAARSGDHLGFVLDVIRAASALELPALVERVATSLQQGDWQWDHTSLCLHDPGENSLRPHLLFAAPGPLAATHGRYARGPVIPIEGTQSGQAFTTGQPCVVNSKAEYESFASPVWREIVRNTFPPAYSSCVIPLVCRGRRLGTLAAASARDGAFDGEAVQFLGRIADALAPAVANALADREIEALKDRLASESKGLEREAGAGFTEMVGDSAAVRQVLDLVELVARTDSTVLICGETGTGKELVARAIHERSDRRNDAFVKLNCAAIPAGLLESELFGHERGAFTGAVGQKAGRVELANDGSLFLDEIGEIPLDIQPKLLRLLQEREFERLGGTRTTKVDARVIAATNRDLPRMRTAGTFRSDLFYRLNVFPIPVPPLRERLEDIPALARHLAARAARRLKRTISDIAPAALATLAQYHWPGNVRELENVIERAVILSTSSVLQVSRADLEAVGGMTDDMTPAPVRGDANAATARRGHRTLAEAERAFILEALEESGWVVGGRSGAAARLGLSRTTLQARMRKLAIVREK